MTLMHIMSNGVAPYFFTGCSLSHITNTISAIAEPVSIQKVASIDVTRLLADLDSVMGIILSIVTGVGIILGLGYFRKFKEKQMSAAFGFWSHLNMLIAQIKAQLSSSPYLLSNMFSESPSLSETGTPPEKETKLLLSVAEEALEYLKCTPDQIPAYIGWSEDIVKLKVFLYEIVLYNVTDSENQFIDMSKYRNERIDMTTYVNENICMLEKIHMNILRAQKQIEMKICDIASDETSVEDSTLK